MTQIDHTFIPRDEILKPVVELRNEIAIFLRSLAKILNGLTKIEKLLNYHHNKVGDDR